MPTTITISPEEGDGDTFEANGTTYTIIGFFTGSGFTREMYTSSPNLAWEGLKGYEQWLSDDGKEFTLNAVTYLTELDLVCRLFLHTMHNYEVEAPRDPNEDFLAHEYEV
jgi:hypothetical protein